MHCLGSAELLRRLAEEMHLAGKAALFQHPLDGDGTAQCADAEGVVGIGEARSVLVQPLSRHAAGDGLLAVAWRSVVFGVQPDLRAALAVAGVERGGHATGAFLYIEAL